MSSNIDRLKPNLEHRGPLPIPRVGTAEQLRFADFFAGIGGFHLAFESIGATCVFASENDPHARAAYEANFKHRSPALFADGKFAGDIRDVDVADIPNFDVLCAGFPCQPFSIAGPRRGFDDPRGTLFFEIARVLKAKQPAAFFLENVRGLQSHDGGRTLRIIESILTDQLGYSLHTKIVKACEFGLPQLRPRLFMVGFRDPDTAFDWPTPIPLEMSMDDVFEGKCHRKIGWTVLVGGDGKRPGLRGNWDGYYVNGRLERLQPRQCLRMQGFPRDFILSEAKTHARRQIGNAVAVPAVAAVAGRIAVSLNFPIKEQPL